MAIKLSISAAISDLMFCAVWDCAYTGWLNMAVPAKAVASAMTLHLLLRKNVVVFCDIVAMAMICSP